MKRYIFSLYLAFISTFLFAQEQHLSFESISPEKGFSAPLVRGVLQDSDGFLWFGAVNGVYRYDGFNLKPYVYDENKKKNITKGYVNVIYEDSKKNFWIGTGGGLNKLDRSTGEFEPYIPDPSGHVFKNYIWSIFEDSKGILWIGAMGLYTMDQKANKLKLMAFPKELEKLNNISFQTITEDKNGVLWFGTTIGLFKYYRETNQFVPVLIDPDADKLNLKNWNTGNFSMPGMFNENSKYIWIGTYGGKLLKIDPVTEKIIQYTLIDSTNMRPIAINSIAEENDNQFWLGTYSGLILFEKNTGKILSHNRFNENAVDGLTDDQIISVLKDKSGTLWAGTLMGGLNRVNRTQFPFKKIIKKALMRDRSNSLVPFRDFFVSKSGSVFFGTYEGIEEIKPDLKTIIKYPPYKPILLLMEDTHLNQWIAIKQIAGGGLFIKDTKGNLTPVLDSLGKPFLKEIQCLFESSKGRIYFGTEFLLFEVDPVDKKAHLLFQTRGKIYAIAEDKQSNLIIGTLLGGMYIFDPVKKIPVKNFIVNEKDSTGLMDNIITNLYTDSKKRIWVLTSIGLSRFDPDKGTFKRYSSQHGLDHNVLLCMIEDNNGILWLGTGNGISRFDPETETIKNFNKSYGMVEGYHYGAGMYGNRIFFKAQPGITYFSPEDVKLNSFIPPVKITEFKIFDKSFPVQEKIELAYDENYISFEFAALSFISPERNLYAYKMEGVDKDWIFPQGRRYAAYTDLKPGKYFFKVKGSNNDGIWNNEGTTLSIIVSPPWWQTYWAYSAYVLVVIMLFYGWRKYDLKRQNLKFQLQTEHQYTEKLQEISDMKSRFFTNISHELRTPLTLIVGPAENIISGKEQDPVRSASMIKKNALRLLRLINQLLDIARLDEGRMSLKVSCSNLTAYLRSIVMIFESLAQTKEIALVIRPEKEEIYGYFDKEKVEKIFINIISNAIKFTQRGGKISVVISESNSKAVIKVKDTGIGIPEKELNKLFDRFYQVDHYQTREYSGTGIGLSLTKDLVEMHKGKISVQSVLGEWTEFTVELPIQRNAFDEKNIIEKTDEAPEVLEKAEQLKDLIKADLTESLVSSAVPDERQSYDEEDENMILLIVEDNADVREYLKNILKDEFVIEEAANGEQGVIKAGTIIPDLIISDIMMPKMDGYEMAHLLKTDEKTNHIPIILLTAKSDRESKLEGLETGADDYLIKPFDIQELQIRIRNLINVRRTLQEKFSGKEKIPVKEVLKKLSPLDEKFMLKILDILNRHLTEEDFSIDEFSKEAGMSRTQLHRKLKALTGKSAGRYIRSYRLSIAKEMLEKQQGNISEIAYSVGFSSPVYFTRCFKEEFGCPPSEVQHT